jgi:hypothetical protein
MSFTIERESYSVILPSPEHGDGHLIDPAILVRYNRSNNPFILKDSDLWPTQRMRTFLFTTMTDEVIADLSGALKAWLGKTVSITDHEDNEYDAYIINDEVNIITDRDTCSHSVELKLLVKE